MTAIPPLPPKTNNPLATWSLTLSIFGLVLGPCCPPLMLFFSIPAVICGHKARGRIQRAVTKEGAGTSLAGLIVGYVGMALTIVSLPISLAIAVPAFAKARSRAQEVQQATFAAACQINVAQIQAAKDQYMLDHQAALPASMDDLVKAGLPATATVCPGGGTYELGGLNAEVTCSKHSSAPDEPALPKLPEADDATSREK